MSAAMPSQNQPIHYREVIMILSYSSFRWMARLLGGAAAIGAFALAANTASAAIITVTTDLDEFNLLS